MKKQIIGICGIFISVLVIFALFFVQFVTKNDTRTQAGKQKVLLNEIRQLSKEEDGSIKAAVAIDALEKSIDENHLMENRQFLLKIAIGFCIIGFLYTTFLFAYVYHKMIRPFEKLENYAQEIAGGNLDVKLSYERTNYFGAFTWAFDHMRKEILFARKKEADAIEANKTIIASLSHDLKTPIASIRAYSEGLEANLDGSFEKRARYVSTIMKKCDEVTVLINDLVLHSLSELEKLTITLEETKIEEVIKETVLELSFEELTLIEPVKEAILLVDAKRVEQVLENLLNNARKYAPLKPVEVSTKITSDTYGILVKDHGNGILPEDLPFIKDKFYRGKNVADKPGSGLGLYIVEYLMKEMHGGVNFHNCTDGLCVEIWFPLYFS